MTTRQIFGMVMAGGKGTRLWPKSTEAFPKQYLSLMGGQSFLKKTLHRLQGPIPKNNLYLLVPEDQKSLARKEWGQVMTEPEGRNTAPALYLSLLELKERGCQEGDVVGFFPADHHIHPVETFRQTLETAIEKALKRDDHIVLLGITPHSPHTGYGHIKKGDGDEVAHFVEKPPLEKAKEYVESGCYLWNGGMFVGTWKAFYEHFQKFCPDYPSIVDPKSHYEKFSSASFDHAVLEHSDRLLFVEGKFQWTDVGNWKALEGILGPHGHNTLVGSTSVSAVDSRGNIVWDDCDHVAL
ncbi:MAG: mannose-1-phosphate guanylyltransferase, partial [Bacteriovoracales bacterium]|nr:mannose-1-phosphate guanylyltransferase [Bacteriovoracales bacterium]